MDNNETLKELINQLTAALRKYDRLRFDEEQSRELGPPATDEQITKLENVLKLSLPPSYRAFLELHNGWSDFEGGAKLLAVEDHDSAWVKERIASLSDLVSPGENPFYKGAIPLLLGVDESNFAVLDSNSIRENGEMDIVTYDYMYEEKRFSDLYSFLQYKLEILQMLIDRETKGIDDEYYYDKI